MTDILVLDPQTVEVNGVRYRAAIGKAGIAKDKTEGDNMTPTGSHPIRLVLYRADKIEPPQTSFSLQPITHDMGWCDAPEHAEYNRPVLLPFAASHEKLWREDDVYDVIVVLGYNDAPVVSGKGSAIFLHVAKPDYAGTEGCVALALPDLLKVLAVLGEEANLIVPETLAFTTSQT